MVQGDRAGSEGGGVGKVQTNPDGGDNLGVTRGKTVCEIILEPGSLEIKRSCLKSW